MPFVDEPVDTVAPPVDQFPEVEQRGEYLPLAADAEPGVEEGSSLQPVEIAWLLWGKRRFLLHATTAGLVLFTLIAFLLPKQYTATTRLMPPDYNSTATLATGLPSLFMGGDIGGASAMGVASQLLGLNSPGELLVGVLGSTTVQDRIIASFGLMKLFSARYPEDARKKLESITEIKPDRKTGIISISVEDKDPRRAAAIAQAYVEELDRLLAQVNTSAAHRERVFIEDRLNGVKKELDVAATEFSEFASKNSAFNIPEQTRAMVEAAAALQAQLIAAESELKGLLQIYTDQNVRIRAVKARIAELQRQLEKFGGKDVTPTKEAGLASGQLYPSMRQLPLLGVKYMDLYRRTRINEEVFELLTKQYELAKVQEARGIPSVQVLDPALVPQKKSSPRRLWIMLAGMCLWFAFGAAWVIGGAHWERLHPQHPWKLFGQEVFQTARARSWDSVTGLRIRAAADEMASRLPILRRNHKEQNGDSPE